jgi:hypothetical protein
MRHKILCRVVILLTFTVWLGVLLWAHTLDDMTCGLVESGLFAGTASGLAMLVAWNLTSERK